MLVLRGRSFRHKHLNIAISSLMGEIKTRLFSTVIIKRVPNRWNLESQLEGEVTSEPLIWATGDGQPGMSTVDS